MNLMQINRKGSSRDSWIGNTLYSSRSRYKETCRFDVVEVISICSMWQKAAEFVFINGLCKLTHVLL